jgi:hypothetical protein
MRDSTLFKIALVITVIGLALLFLVQDNINITSDTNLEYVKLTGKVENIVNTGSVTIMEISKQDSVDVVMYDVVRLKVGDEIEILGEFDEYEGETQIIAQRVRVI